MNTALSGCLRPRDAGVLRALLLLLVLGLTGSQHADGQALHAPHPLELRALREPHEVLVLLPAQLAAARQAQQPLQLALLYLAQANACRVVANWPCQRSAGNHAAEAARAAGAVDLQVRGLIAQARGAIALSDYTRGEHTLGQAELLLGGLDAPALAADVYLAYSTLSFRLGKQSLSVDYADKGLAVLPAGSAVPMQVRLWRNRADALIRLGDFEQVRASLDQAAELVQQVDDPKLQGEILLVQARLAFQREDSATQLQIGQQLLGLSADLDNTQLRGLGFEVLGLARLQAGETALGVAALHAAVLAFRELDLLRDEHRALAELLKADQQDSQWQAWIDRYIALGQSISRHEQAVAADDFEEHLSYARQEAALQQMSAEAVLQAERSGHLEDRLRDLIAQLTLAILLLVSLGGWLLLQRRHSRQLADAVSFRQNALLQTSHELRNPLSGIIGLSELMLTQTQAPSQAEKLRSIHSAALQLQRLAQDLLDRGRLEAGQLRLQPEPVDLWALLDQLRRWHEPMARRHGLELTVVAARQSLPATVSVDGTRLTQVLNNLLGNALKFTQEGGVRLEVVPLAGAPRGYSRLHFCVSDSGPGMSASELQQLFRPFAKLRAGKLHRSGAGLGLSISHELIALMGGTLTVTSSEGVGSEFSFVLDLVVPAEPSPSLLRSVEGEEDAETDLVPLQALILDDDPDVLLVHEAVLGQLQVRTSACATVEEARRALASDAYDVLLMDMELGQGQDSLGFSQEASMVHERPHVVVISGQPVPPVLPESVDEWLEKPVTMARWAMLLARIRSRRLGRKTATP